VELLEIQFLRSEPQVDNINAILIDMSLLNNSGKTCLSLFLVLLVFTGHVQSQPKPSIYVVNYPLKYFAERIGGDLVDVEFPSPSDVDPAYWTPNAEVIRDYQMGDLILLNGADYAKWVKKATLPKSKLVDTSKSFKDQYITLEDVVTHSHGPTGEHAHKGVAFTTWLNPLLAIKQSEAIKKAFLILLPQDKEIIERNYESLTKDLLEPDNNIKEIVSAEPEKPLLASHPVYQYLAKQYGLNLKSLNWEPDQMPGLDQWQELANILKTHPAKWMIWEDTPIDETKEQLESLGVESIVFNPSGNAPEKGDYMSVMYQNVENLKMVFQ